MLFPGVGLLALATFVARTWPQLQDISRKVRGLEASRWAVLAAASAILLLGHVLRAARTKVPIDNVRPSTVASQFHSLAVGYFFNIVLPLRLGEIVRSFLIARKLRISFLYTLLAVLLERLIDVILVASAFLGFSLVLKSRTGAALSVAAAAAILLCLALIGLFVLLVRENRVILRAAWRLSSLLNTSLENLVRFKIWSVIFGFQRFFRRSRQLVRYGSLVTASWTCYVAASAMAALAIFPQLSSTETMVASAAPYAVVSPSIGSGAPARYLAKVEAFVVEIGALDGPQVVTFAAVSWIILNLPTLAIALIALFFINLRPRRPAPSAALSNHVYTNKLGRDEDISQHFPAFLDSYFQGRTLSRVLHKLEVSGNISLVRFFKGGSNAVTVLVMTKDELYVKKLVPLEHAAGLKAQHDWLASRHSLDHLVRVLREDKADEYYALDLQYQPQSVPLFDYVHERPLADGTRMLSRVWSFMYASVYQTRAVGAHCEARDAYVRTRLIDRVLAAAETHEELNQALQSDQIMVNGRMLLNLEAVIEKIQGTPAAWHDLATYRESASIHGDLTVDNILVDMATGDPVVIDPDPSPGNLVCGPLIDFARQMQSLQFGYESLNQDESPVSLGTDAGIPQIVFADHRSARYAELADYVTTEIMTKHLSGAEQRSVMFYTGLCFGRMMIHRVVINPDNALKYYAACICALNGFLDQYDLSKG